MVRSVWDFQLLLMTECQGLLLDWMQATRTREESRLVPRDTPWIIEKTDLWSMKMGNTVCGRMSLVLDLSILKCRTDMEAEMSDTWTDIQAWNLGESLGLDVERWAIFQVQMVFKVTGPEDISRRVRGGNKNSKHWQLVHSCSKRCQRWWETSKRDWETWKKRHELWWTRSQVEQCFGRERVKSELTSHRELVKADFRSWIHWF